jgi:hypothetical protein
MYTDGSLSTPRPTLLPTLITRALVLLYLRSPRTVHISVKRPPAQCARPIARCVLVHALYPRPRSNRVRRSKSLGSSVLFSAFHRDIGTRVQTGADLTGSVERVFRASFPKQHEPRPSSVLSTSIYRQTDMNSIARRRGSDAQHALER